jgi:hypothetical protein
MIAVNVPRMIALRRARELGLEPSGCALLVIHDGIPEPEVEEILRADWATTLVECFFDVDDPEEDLAITEEQANSISLFLLSAREAGLNVVAACKAGVSRSGGVVEAATALGFCTKRAVVRVPNSLVRRRIVSAFPEEAVWDAEQQVPRSRFSRAY